MNMKYKNIVLFIPHSSDALDKSLWSGDIDAAVDRWTDWHTDKLFDSDDARISKVVVPFSRFHCDAERLINDPMESIGQGIAYQNIEGCTRELSDAAKQNIYNQYYSIHQELEEKSRLGSLIIDCHSFPSDLAPDIDICIGYNDDDSKPADDVLDMVIDHFNEAGFRVGVNDPYSNSMRVNASIPTLMIEFNKAIYLQTDGKTLSSDAYKKNFILKQLYMKLLEDC